MLRAEVRWLNDWITFWLHAEYLFPAASLMAKQKEDPQFSLTKVPHTELYFALNARCSTKASRQVSFSALNGYPAL